MALVTLALLAGALWLARAPPDRTLRAVQVFVVLPTGALFLAGGGDDLPVLAISLFGVAAVAQRREVARRRRLRPRHGDEAHRLAASRC